MNARFPKAEHLCSRKLIDRLYTEGHRLMAFPYSVQWLPTGGQGESDTDNTTPCQVMIVAPKRKFKHAVDRNRVRRLTRECYRLRKQHLHDFLHEHGISIAFSMVYVHNEIMPYSQLGHKMDKLIAALENDIKQKLEIDN